MPKLTVTIVSGRNLAVRDGDTSDPYVKLRVNSIQIGKSVPWQKTKVQKKNLNPIFNETFHLDVDKYDILQNLEIEVYDHDMLSKGILLAFLTCVDDFMGKGFVIINNLVKKKPTKVEIPLRETESGSITVTLTAEDFGAAE